MGCLDEIFPADVEIRVALVEIFEDKNAMRAIADINGNPRGGRAADRMTN